MASALPNTELHFRKLSPADRDAFERHLVALDAQSCRLRFGMATTEAFLRQYAERCITLNATIHGAFLGEALIGVAELRPIGDFLPSEAEIAFSVLERWRNQGVGAMLFARTLRSARNRGFSRLYMTCLRGNAPMQALARKFSAEISVTPDESVALIEAPPRTIISLLREALEDASAFTLSAFEWQRKAARRRSPSGDLTR